MALIKFSLGPGLQRTEWGFGPALQRRPVVMNSTIEELEKELEKTRARGRYASGELTDSITKGVSLSHVCWTGGKVLFDERGVAVVVGKSVSEIIPVAIVGNGLLDQPGTGHLILSSLLEGTVEASELEMLTMRLLKIAARLVELRVGGWKIVATQRPAANGGLWKFGPYNKQLSYHIHSADIIDPLTDQSAYRFPDNLPRKRKKQDEVLRRLTAELEKLPDSPLLLMDASSNNDRVLLLKEWSDELKHDRYERLALARYPQLPLEEVLAIAEKARQSKIKDTSAAIESSKVRPDPSAITF